MDINQIRDIALETQKNMIAFDEWAESIEKRISTLEQSSSLLVQVQLSLKEFTMSSKYFGEKLQDMRDSLATISNENKAHHEELHNRLKKLEDQPGEKWNKFVWLGFAGAVGAILTFIIQRILEGS